MCGHPRVLFVGRVVHVSRSGVLPANFGITGALGGHRAASCLLSEIWFGSELVKRLGWQVKHHLQEGAASRWKSWARPTFRRPR